MLLIPQIEKLSAVIIPNTAIGHNGITKDNSPKQINSLHLFPLRSPRSLRFYSLNLFPYLSKNSQNQEKDIPTHLQHYLP